MPQASDELRARMKLRFGDEISDIGPMNYLEACGFRQTRGGLWHLPSPNYKPNADELEALQFLMDEWDYGGLIE